MKDKLKRICGAITNDPDRSAFMAVIALLIVSLFTLVSITDGLVIALVMFGGSLAFVGMIALVWVGVYNFLRWLRKYCD